VGRHRDQARAVGDGLAGEVERRGDVGRPVVHAGQKVEMQFDALHTFTVEHARRAAVYAA
jgi:hypothetical protein